MEGGRLPKDILYGEFYNATRRTGRPKLRCKDVIKRDMASLHISPQSWEALAADRNRWRASLTYGYSLSATSYARNGEAPSSSSTMTGWAMMMNDANSQTDISCLKTLFNTTVLPPLCIWRTLNALRRKKLNSSLRRVFRQTTRFASLHDRELTVPTRAPTWGSAAPGLVEKCRPCKSRVKAKSSLSGQNYFITMYRQAGVNLENFT